MKRDSTKDERELWPCPNKHSIGPLVLDMSIRIPFYTKWLRRQWETGKRQPSLARRWIEYYRTHPEELQPTKETDQ